MSDIKVPSTLATVWQQASRDHCIEAKDYNALLTAAATAQGQETPNQSNIDAIEGAFLSQLKDKMVANGGRVSIAQGRADGSYQFLDTPAPRVTDSEIQWLKELDISIQKLKHQPTESEMMKAQDIALRYQSQMTQLEARSKK